jgi:hypothetical protein
MVRPCPFSLSLTHRDLELILDPIFYKMIRLDELQFLEKEEPL